MTAGHAYWFAGSIALCGVIWILGERTYVKYREMQDEPTTIITLPAATVDGMPPVEEKLAVKLPTLEDLNAIVERPMFSPSRRPVEGAVDISHPVSGAVLDLDLVGIVIWQAQRVALVRSKSDPTIIRIEVGANVAGWVAIGIEPEYVRFRNGKTEREVRLKYVDRDDNG